jgi:hypothetical protein
MTLFFPQYSFLFILWHYCGGAFILLTLISVFSSNGQGFRTVGYLPVYRFNTLSKIELEKLTHLNIAFANPDLLGNLTTEGVSISGVVENARQSNVKVYIALAGAGAKLADWENG